MSSTDSDSYTSFTTFLICFSGFKLPAGLHSLLQCSFTHLPFFCFCKYITILYYRTNIKITCILFNKIPSKIIKLRKTCICTVFNNCIITSNIFKIFYVYSSNCLWSHAFIQINLLRISFKLVLQRINYLRFVYIGMLYFAVWFDK